MLPCLIRGRSRLLDQVEKTPGDTVGSVSRGAITARGGAVESGGVSGGRGVDHLLHEGHELFDPGARDDHAVPMAMRFLGDPKKSATSIFPKFNEKMLPLNLQFPCR